MNELQLQVPNANIKPKKHVIKFLFVKTIFNASLNVHYYFLGFLYLVPYFLHLILKSNSGDFSGTNNENINPAIKNAIER